MGRHCSAVLGCFNHVPAAASEAVCHVTGRKRGCTTHKTDNWGLVLHVTLATELLL
jgi:hypothetical protein